MQAKLILIRGNSGSGKTALAKLLQQMLGAGTLLISQDTIRREMLAVKDTAGNAAIALLEHLVEYGKNNCRYVILEGILAKEKYTEMLQRCLAFFEENAAVYYYDIPFETTLSRHGSKKEQVDFGSEQLEKWWLPNNQLGLKNEKLFNEKWTLQEAADYIYHAIISD